MNGFKTNVQVSVVLLRANSIWIKRGGSTLVSPNELLSCSSKSSLQRVGQQVPLQKKAVVSLLSIQSSRWNSAIFNRAGCARL